MPALLAVAALVAVAAAAVPAAAETAVTGGGHARHTYVWVQGAIAAGDDVLPVANMTTLKQSEVSFNSCCLENSL